MFKIGLLYSLIVFVGCVSTTKMGNTDQKQVESVQEKKIIRIYPQIALPIQEQIRWSNRLDSMSEHERDKIEQALIQGMFKTRKEMEELRMLYPLTRDPKEI